VRACSVGARLSSIAGVVLSMLPASCTLPSTAASTSAVAQYDSKTGRLTRIDFDTTHDGRNDAVGIMDGTRVERIEVDEDQDGQVDRWEFYDENRRLERVAFSRQQNGVIDAIAFYATNGTLVRIEISTRGDGRFNRLEHYSSESLARVEEDTNGDGRADKWETYARDAGTSNGEPPSIITAAFDDSFRGTPNRRFVYDPQGTVLRVEVDPDGDGTFLERAPESGAEK